MAEVGRVQNWEEEGLPALEVLDGSVAIDAVLATEPVGDQPLAMSREAVAAGFAWTAGLNVIARVVFPLAGIYISRTLGPTILGIASLLQMTMSFGEIMGNAGLGQTLIAEPDLDARKRANFNGLAILTGSVPPLIILALTPFLTGFFRQPELIWSLPVVAGCLFLNALASMSGAAMLRKGQFKEQGMIGIVSGGISMILSIVLVSLGFGFKALVIQFSTTCLIGVGLTLKAEPLGKVCFAAKEIAATFKKTYALLGANLINNVFLLFDIFVIQKMVGPTAAGLYNSSQNIAYKPADLILFPLSKTLMVAFGQNSTDQQRLARAYWRAITAVVLLIVPMYVFIGLNSGGIILGLLGPKFSGGVPVLAVLSLYLGFRTFGNVSGNALVPAGKHKWTFYPWVMALVVTIGGLALIARAPTLMGIVWCFTAGALTVYTLIFAIAAMTFRLNPDQGKRFKKAALITASTGAVVAAMQFLPLNLYLILAASALVAPIIHLGFIGLAFEGKWFAYFYKPGLRRLWRSL
ncbi:MAG TPA: oligosaccharide flippase family protein [Fimbriimonas sp.]|nr:oligosaccharide flippase family protein [Fimbriimonas sp.]